MPNEFIVKNGLISQGNITISGSITATGGVTVSGSIASASYASNAELLDGLDSTVFTLTSSFNAQTASFTAFTSSMNSFSASILTNVTALNAKTASFATTGSNTFVGAEVISGSLAISGSGTPFTLNTDTLEITGSLLVTGSTTLTGSLLQLGNFTTTGTIIAQTINVQTVTSSIVYSSGSNVFGNSLGNSQTFTGSVLITGSLTIAGASSATSYSGTTIYGSTVACSPIGCFATSCATSFVGGTMSGTTIYGSTAVCSPVGKFTTCLDLGGALTGTSATLSGLLTLSSGAGTKAVWATTRNFGVNRNFQIAVDEYAESAFTITPSTTLGGSSYTTPIFTLAAAGAATFASTITGTTIYGSTAVCSPVGKFTSCIDAGIINGSGFCTSAGIIGNNSNNLYLSSNSAAGEISFWGNQLNTRLVTITGCGCVGIGTATPSSTYGKLTVAGTGISIDDDGNAKLQIGRYSSTVCNAYIKMGTNACSLRFTNNIDSIDLVTIEKGGNVGIGTTNPTRQLFVNSTAFFDNNGDGSTTNPSIAIGTTSVGISYISGGNLAFLTGASERMRITCAGRVAIGRTSPGTALSVAGQCEQWQLALSTDTGSGAVIGSPSANVLAFGDWSGTERMRITACGTVKTQCNQALGALETSGTIANNSCVSLNLNSAGGNASIGFIAIGATRTDTTACQAVRLFSQSHTNGFNTYTSIQGTNDGGITITNNANGGETIYNCSGATVNYVVRYINLISINSIFERQ